jgi:hypothetical protein
MASYVDRFRDTQECTMTVMTSAARATGQNQLSAVSATMVQSVPCSS